MVIQEDYLEPMRSDTEFLLFTRVYTPLVAILSFVVVGLLALFGYLIAGHPLFMMAMFMCGAFFIYSSMLVVIELVRYVIKSSIYSGTDYGEDFTSRDREHEIKSMVVPPEDKLSDFFT